MPELWQEREYVPVGDSGHAFTDIDRGECGELREEHLSVHEEGAAV